MKEQIPIDALITDYRSTEETKVRDRLKQQITSAISTSIQQYTETEISRDEIDVWQDANACSNFPEAMFPETGEKWLGKIAASACRVCIVVKECRQFASANPKSTRFGIWGGSTPNQRKSVIKPRKNQIAKSA